VEVVILDALAFYNDVTSFDVAAASGIRFLGHKG
jgi:hypothetical protein